MAADCAKPATARELLDCVLKNDPRILASEEEIRAAEGRAKAQGAWVNPEIEAEGSREGKGGDGERISASLLQPLDWAGVTRAGARAARKEWEVQKAEHRLLRQEVLGETVSRLVRLKQAAEERGIIEGQVRLCERGLGRFSGLAFLTSEQKAGRQALLWSLERLRLELLDLESEEAQIRLELAISLGMPETFGGDIPALKAGWPEWPKPSNQMTSYFLVGKYRTESAQAALSREGAAAWPSLALGPTVEREESGGQRSDFLGARLSLALPLWNQNGGNRAEAGALLRGAKVLETSTETRLRLTRSLLRGKYTRSVERLSGLEKHFEDGLEKLASIRADYLAGRISLSLALESYRELEELVLHLHGTERSAYEALWRGYALEDMAEEQQP